MGANEKCDMYSFRVEALEVIMGKYPGDLISFLSSSSPQGHQILLKDVFYRRLSAPIHEVAEKIVSIAKIVFSYLQQNPHVRPSMKQVSEKLSPMVSSSSKSTNLVMNTIIIVEKTHYYILCNQKPPTFLLL